MKKDERTESEVREVSVGVCCSTLHGAANKRGHHLHVLGIEKHKWKNANKG